MVIDCSWKRDGKATIYAEQRYMKLIQTTTPHQLDQFSPFLTLSFSLALPQTSSCTYYVVGFQWPNHFFFPRNVSTCFMCASFLMSSFLMWSNLVFPLAHLDVQISAEFTTQHSEPYVIAGLMIVLKNLSFNATGIFLSHNFITL